MAQKLFSSTLSPNTAEITNALLRASLDEIKRITGKTDLFLLSWDENRIAVPIEISVDLPPLGNYNNVDIRAVEPVLLVFNLKEYPLTAPWTCPDRVTFPKDTLGHMYIARKGRPPGFCLVRGSLNEWYANKRPKDLLIRISNWLRDAATGDLNEDGNQFEPLRLQGYYGIIIYDYDRLATIVNASQSYEPDSNFAMALFERTTTERSTVMKLDTIVTKDNIDEIREKFKQEGEKDTTDTTKRNFHFGYIVWSQDQVPYSDYSVELPENWEDLKSFCSKYGIEINGLEEHLALKDLNRFIKIPVIAAIKRPKMLIGFSGNIEFVNYYILLDTTDVAEGKIINNIEVGFQKHNQPLTVKKAKEISGNEFNLGKYTLLAGCGALGSKVAMHLVRNGTIDIFFTDPDELAPHNLVRHAAFAEGEGCNKAVYLRNSVKKMYPGDETILSLGGARKGEYMLKGATLDIFDTILDFTASPSFFQFLVNLRLNKKSRIIRGAISDSGDLGILFTEGLERNPRLDDLQSSLYALSLTDIEISEWLQREANNSRAAIDIKVGIGCNSETFVIADNTISLHAACMAGVLKAPAVSKEGCGNIYLNSIRSAPYFHNVTKSIDIKPFTVMQAVNDASWQIHIKTELLESVQFQLTQAYPRETGGVLVGTANFKTRTIHVVSLIDAPPDSRANSVCFFRGVQGLKSSLDTISTLSGGQLGYIGEWHTHPDGPNRMSETDTNTVRRFKQEFDDLPAPLPVFLMILTHSHILPYVY